MANAEFRKPDLKVIPLGRETLQDQVYRRICDMILDGEIEPGQVVTIPSIADACSVSHMPVREALKRLMAENALTVVSGRSIGIPKLSRERLSDLRDVRVELECYAAARAARNVQPDEIALLRDQYRELEGTSYRDDVKSYLRANRVFHFSIYAAARSPTLLSLIENLWLQIGPYLNLLKGSGNPELSNLHHRHMIEGLEQRDEAKMRAAMRDDIDKAYNVLMSLLK